MSTSQVQKHVQRFAEVSVEIFGHEGTFDISPPDPQDLGQLKLAYEAMGCKVVSRQFTYGAAQGLSVTVPKTLRRLGVVSEERFMPKLERK
jgi:hypothetical protein